MPLTLSPAHTHTHTRKSRRGRANAARAYERENEEVAPGVGLHPLLAPALLLPQTEMRHVHVHKKSEKKHTRKDISAAPTPRHRRDGDA